MRIALIGTTAGCVLGFRTDLIKTLVQHGHSVYAFALDYDDVSKQKVRALGAEPVDYTFARTGVNPFSDISNTYRLAKRLKGLQLDLVFSYFSKPVIFATLAAVFARVKRRIGMLEGLGYIFTDHPNGNGVKITLLRRIQVMLYRISFRFLERIIFLNPDDPVDLLQRYNIKVPQVSVLGGIGLNLAEYPYSEPPKAPVSFIFVGRLLAEKGVNEFIGAAKKIKESFPEVKCVMLGGLDEENPGGLTASRLSLLTQEGTVIHPGHVENVQEWLQNASVFVLPSYYREGVPRSTQEAMAIGRAIITTDVPGCRETVVDGVNGFFVKPWSPGDLAAKMKKFIENPELIVSMGLESHKMAREKFDATEVNSRLVEFFE
jgi:glycosyltransferase involved in cell wall biosynthesis